MLIDVRMIPIMKIGEANSASPGAMSNDFCITRKPGTLYPTTPMIVSNTFLTGSHRELQSSLSMDVIRQ